MTDSPRRPKKELPRGDTEFPRSQASPGGSPERRYGRGSQPGRDVLEEMLELVEDLDYHDGEAGDKTKAFQRSYCNKLAKGKSSMAKGKVAEEAKERSILHEMALAKSGVRAKFTAATEWLVKTYPHLLVEMYHRQYITPLHMAFSAGNAAFLAIVFRLADSDASIRALARMALRMNRDARLGSCLHIAIKNASPLTHFLMDFYPASERGRGTASIFLSKDGDKNTPLHTAIIKIHDDFNIQQQPVAVGLDLGWDHFPPLTTPPDEATAQSNPSTPKEADRTQKYYEKEFNAFEVVKALVQACHDALCSTDASGLTPYQLQRHYLETAWQGNDEEKLRRMVDNDSVVSLIRTYCIRYLPQSTILRAFYGRGEEHNIDFDLSGLSTKAITQRLLTGLSQHLKFESSLKYVALPRLRLPASITRDTSEGGKDSHNTQRIGEPGKEPPNPEPRGLADLVDVFKWLRGNHVTKIFRVIVVDNQEPSHTDAAIVDALSNFDVRVWDWRKLDLCTDVIYDAARNVEEVTLYSSGKTAVLLGWSSNEGLPRLEKLRKVKLVYSENLECPERQIEAFMKRLARNAPSAENSEQSRIEVEPEPENPTKPISSGFGDSSRGSTPTEHLWLQYANKMRQFLMRFKHVTNEPEIKIAVIDSGIDTSLGIFGDRIAAGKSFYPYPNSGECKKQYYVPEGEHGTQMAYFICKIFPRAKLYIARLEDRETRPGEVSFTAKSAKEALDWAVGCGVHIISMSWTIEARNEKSPDMASLEKAIQTAKEHKVLMFCAVDDKGINSSQFCYPGKSGLCTRIGAANENGKICDWVPDDGTDLIFPGLNVPYEPVTGRILSYESGSSVATAIAAAFAGVLLYLDALVALARDEQDDEGDFENGHFDANADNDVGSVKEDYTYVDYDADGARSGSQGHSADPGTAPGAMPNAADEGNHYDLRVQRDMFQVLSRLCRGKESPKFPMIEDLFSRKDEAYGLAWDDPTLRRILKDKMHQLKLKPAS
ncbi:hypothetical protein C8A00DRAFT_38114 [Chaetomidium leptoderma]|uniref:Peptidase S8/S53 domain-containing protein n=1 Tax=Chaetomidium leptoderma TaxID=669021 RepID=A0AAN6VD79_9PEZI|nr:hypothetical protein C8A00DRAFT_38114 [Chaetomidium leptoderma]